MAFDVDLEEIEVAQAMARHLMRDRCTVDLVSNYFAFVAQVTDPRQLCTVDPSGQARTLRGLVQYKFATGLARNREIEAGCCR